jgi:hypothetical protein
MATMKTITKDWANGRLMAGMACIIGMATAATANAQISLFELSRYNLNSTSNAANAEFIGSNPIAIGWNGSSMYVAGLNSGTGTVNTSVIQITNASTSARGLITPTYSSTFGTLSTVASRGYTGLSLKGNSLAASWDNGSNSPNGIQMFNAATNTRTWNLTNNGTSTTANIGTTRGYAGPDFDPGYVVSGTSQGGSGLAWVTQGQGRRFLNDTTSGTAIYTTTANNPSGAQQGMIINIAPTSTTWRDIAFDPNSGNLYTRVNNQVSRTNRTGANTDLSPSGTAGLSDVIVALTANNAVGTNLGYLDSVAAGTVNTYTGDVLVYNDRASNAAGQLWTSTILFATTSGSPLPATWDFIGGSAPGTGNALYDFQWDSASQTLAVVDFTNRTASIFTTSVPEPTTTAVAGMCTVGLASLILRGRRRSEDNS